MNILFCYRNNLNPKVGGVQRVCDILAKYFNKYRHKVYYLNLIDSKDDGYEYPAEIYLLPDSNFYSSVNIDFYHNLLYHLSIDIVFNHDSSNERSKLWLNTGKHPAKKISLYHTDPLHGLNSTNDEPIGLRGYIFKRYPYVIHFLKILKKKGEIGFLLRNSDRLVFLSDEFKKEVFKELRISSSKIDAINSPCNSYSSYDSYNKKKQILFVARMELAGKRPDKMLQIWSQMQDKFPDWELLFLGDGPDRIKVELIAKSLNLRNVRFEGFVDPVPYYKAASIICMTSDYEGFGLVLPEAMQFGVVPIAFNNWCSLKDIVINEETGIVVDSGNMSDYVKKLDQLISDNDIRNRISANSREHSKKFEIERIGPMWLRLFNDLFNENK